MTKLDEDKIWEIVRKAKQDQKNYCGNKDFLPNNIQTSLIHEVEVQLQIGRMDQNKLNSVSNEMTESIINTASAMFFNLTSCPGSLKPWILFYTDLFQVQSPQKIALTLNRIRKGNKTPENTKFINIAEKIFKKVTTSLSLKYSQLENDNLLVPNVENGTLSKGTTDHFNCIESI